MSAVIRVGSVWTGDKIRINCTQCGNPLKIPEGDRSVKCPYCGMVLLITAPNRILKFYLNTELHRRSIKFITEGHCKRSGLKLPSRIEEPILYYVPFWRFGGVRYWLYISVEYIEIEGGPALEAARRVEVDSKPFDLSFPGSDIPLVRDIFLGIRSQTMELLPSLPESLSGSANIIKPEIILDHARDMAYEKAGVLEDKANAVFEELIGEKLTLIYFPVWVSRFINSDGKYHLIIDGVSKRAVCRHPGDIEEIRDRGGFEGVTSIEILPHHCPECGADLPAGGEAVVFHCGNCGRGWYLEGNGLIHNEQEFAEVTDRDVKYYPFWRFEASFNSGDNLLTYKQAKQFFMNNLSLFIDDSLDEIFRFYVPAFSFRNPDQAWKLMANLTRSQPEIKFENDLTAREFTPCTLPQDEAAEFARVLWFYLFYNSRGSALENSIFLDDIPDVHFRPGHVVYLPMKEDGIYLKEQISGFTIQKRAVS